MQTLFGATIGCGLGQPLTLPENPHDPKLLQPHELKLLHPQDVGLLIGRHEFVIFASLQED